MSLFANELSAVHPTVACTLIVCGTALMGWVVYWLYRVLRDIN